MKKRTIVLIFLASLVLPTFLMISAVLFRTFFLNHTKSAAVPFPWTAALCLAITQRTVTTAGFGGLFLSGTSKERQSLFTVLQ
jgi:hypothetical protein